MDYKELANAVKLCGSTPKVDQCKECSYWAGGDMSKCIPRMAEDAAAAITDLLARAESAEQKATELDNALSNASKVVKTMQESTIPYYRKRAEAAEKEVEWKNKVIEAAERRFMEAEARAEKGQRERDAAISELTFAVNQYRLFTTDIDLCGLCKFDLPPAGESGQTAECPGFYKDNCFEWRGQKED